MPYVERDGDWCRRQPASIEEAELFVFPIPLQKPGKLADLCDRYVTQPTKGHVSATPWSPLPGGDPILLLAAARFSKIRSADPQEPLKGYIDELDVGFFFPVELAVAGNPRGIHVFNPYIYVDNPAGVIMGREIFGFSKIEGAIGWWPSVLEFDLRSLVFTNDLPNTAATVEKVLELKRSPLLSFLSPLFGGYGSNVLGEDADTRAAIAKVTQALAQNLLDWIQVAAAAKGFTQVHLPLLKQYRSVDPGDDTAYQEVVRATFTIETISAFEVYPKFLFWLSPLTLHLYSYANLHIATELGIASNTEIERGFRVVCKLKLEGSTF
jgi:hypothetical protein